MSAAAAALGPTLGALLIEYVSWRWIFLVNVPIGAAVILFSLRTLRESRDPRAAGLPDPVGILLIAAIPALLSFAIVEGPSWGWTGPKVLAAFAAGAALLPVFLWRSARAADPVIDLKLFHHRGFRLVNAATLVFATSFYGLLLSNIIFLQTVWHYSVLTAALASTPGPIVVTAVSRPMSRLAGRIGHRPVLLGGALVWTLGTAGYALTIGTSAHWFTGWLPFNLLIGLGIGMTLPVQSAASAATLPPAQYGVGSAVNSSFRQLGAVLGISVFVAIVGQPASAAAAIDAFHHVWWTFAALGAASGAILLTPRLGRARELATEN